MFLRQSIVLVLASFLVTLRAYPQYDKDDKNVSIRIIQDHSVQLNDFQTTIQLKRKVFKFQVMLRNMDGVYVFASVRDSVYRFTESGPIRDFAYLPLLEMREDRFNTNKELNIAETGWSYWFYDSKADWHPFHRKIIALDSNSVVCTKVVKQFYDVAESQVVRVKDVGPPLYLFFVAVSEYDDKGKPVRELMRRKVKIEWLPDED